MRIMKGLKHFLDNAGRIAKVLIGPRFYICLLNIIVKTTYKQFSDNRCTNNTPLMII